MSPRPFFVPLPDQTSVQTPGPAESGETNGWTRPRGRRSRNVNHPLRLIDSTTGVVHLDPTDDRPGAIVAYRRTGHRDRPTLIVLGGISAHRSAWDHDGSGRNCWWPSQVGPERAIDPGQWDLLTIDWIGGPDASGWVEASIDERCPATPLVQAEGLCAVLDQLGVARVHAVIGASYGGMVGLAFAARFPERLGRLLVLSAAHESHPTTTALRSIQRRIVRHGVRWGAPDAALATARALAVIGYRSPQEFAARFAGPAVLEGRGAPALTVVPGQAEGTRFPVDSYLDHSGQRILDRFDADSYLCLSEGLDLHRVTPEEIRTPVFAWGTVSDQIVPITQMETLVGRLGGRARLLKELSIYGHDGFLKEDDSVGRFLAHSLRDELPGWKEVRA